VALAGPLMGWSTLLLGWATVAGAAVRTWARSRGRPAVIASALTLLFAGLFAPAAVLHGLALRAEHAAPRAISLDPELEAREGPGTHRKVTFVLQAGSRVRIIDRSPGWTQIRLEGGLSGWIPERALGLVDGDDAAAAVLPPGAQGS
jgi:SH3-like domain-containing protein